MKRTTTHIALGAGAGMVIGWILGNAATGLVIGATVGLIMDLLTRRRGGGAQ